MIQTILLRFIYTVWIIQTSSNFTLTFADLLNKNSWNTDGACKTFDCLPKTFAEELQSNSNQEVSILHFIHRHLGSSVATDVSALFKKIHLQHPVIQSGRVEHQSTAFKSSGYLQDYMTNGSTAAELETIISAEDNGAGLIACGITFPTINKPADTRRLMILPIAGSFFLSLIGAIGGIPKIPKVNFLMNYTDIGVIAIEGYRLPPEIWESVKDEVSYRPSNNLSFSGVLEHFPLQTGIKVVARANFNGKCEKLNYPCHVMSHFKKAGTTVEVHFDPGYSSNGIGNILGSRVLTIALGNQTISDNIFLKDLGVYVQMDFQGFTMGIIGVSIIKVNDDQRLRFTLSTGLSLDTPLPVFTDLIGMIESVWSGNFQPWIPTLPSIGIPMEFAMTGFWQRAFGIPFVHFGNLVLATKLDAFTLAIQDFSLGGEAWFGHVPESFQEVDERFKAKIYASWHPVNPLQNYFIAHVSKITIQTLFDTMPNAIQLPKVFGDTGLHPVEGNSGILVSWAFLDMQVRHTSPAVIIRSGFRAEGMLNFFSYKVKAKVELDHIQRILVLDFEMDPIILPAGILKLQHSQQNATLGPHFLLNASIGNEKYFRMDYSGYLSVLGMGSEVQGTYNESGLYLYQGWKLWNLVSVELSLAMDFEAKRTHIQGEFLRNNLMDQLQRSTNESLIDCLALAEYRQNRVNLLSKTGAEAFIQLLKYIRYGLYKSKLTLKASRKYMNKGKWLLALSLLTSAGKQVVRSFLPMSVKILRIAFDMDLEKANKQAFAVDIHLSIRVLQRKKLIVIQSELDLQQPRSWSRQIGHGATLGTICDALYEQFL